MRITVTSLFLAALSLSALSVPASAQKRSQPDTAKAKAPSAPAAAPVSPAAATPAPAATVSPAVADSAKVPAEAPAPAATAAPAVDTVKTLAPAAAAPVDTAKAPAAGATAAPDTARPAASAAAAPVDSAAADTASAKPKKRKRIVRETTVNTIDELKGRYRSPKKALFMSLVVPGLGQAYVGQSVFNYTRGFAYLLTDIGLAMGWRHYVGTKQDRQIARYRAFADSNWRISRYEDEVSKYTEKLKFATRFPHRETYCQSVQSQVGDGERLYNGCLSPEDKAVDYDAFRNQKKDAGIPADSVGSLRAEFPNAHNFYELIGKEVEFVLGWQDASGITVGDTSFTMVKDGKTVPATTDLQQEYIGMRAKANDYARMQAWFLGGIVLNHIVSALDAAFAAHFHNKGLYQTEIGLLDRLRLDSRVGWEEGAPRPQVTASLTF